MDPRVARNCDGGSSNAVEGWRRGSIVLLLDLLDFNPSSGGAAGAREPLRGPRGVATPGRGSGSTSNISPADGASGGNHVTALPLHLDRLLSALPVQPRPRMQVVVQQTPVGGASGGGGGVDSHAAEALVVEWSGAAGGWRMVHHPQQRADQPQQRSVLQIPPSDHHEEPQQEQPRTPPAPPVQPAPPSCTSAPPTSPPRQQLTQEEIHGRRGIEGSAPGLGVGHVGAHRSPEYLAEDTTAAAGGDISASVASFHEGRGDCAAAAVGDHAPDSGPQGAPLTSSSQPPRPGRRERSRGGLRAFYALISQRARRGGLQGRGQEDRPTGRSPGRVADSSSPPAGGSSEASGHPACSRSRRSGGSLDNNTLRQSELQQYEATPQVADLTRWLELGPGQQGQPRAQSQACWGSVVGPSAVGPVPQDRVADPGVVPAKPADHCSGGGPHQEHQYQQPVRLCDDSEEASAAAAAAHAHVHAPAVGPSAAAVDRPRAYLDEAGLHGSHMPTRLQQRVPLLEQSLVLEQQQQQEPQLDDDYMDQLWRALRQRPAAVPPPQGSPAAAAAIASAVQERGVDASCSEQQLLEALRSLCEEYGGVAGKGCGACYSTAAATAAAIATAGVSGLRSSLVSTKDMVSAAGHRQRSRSRGLSSGVVQDLAAGLGARARRRRLEGSSRLQESVEALALDGMAGASTGGGGGAIPSGVGGGACGVPKTSPMSISGAVQVGRSGLTSGPVEGRIGATAAAAAAAEIASCAGCTTRDGAAGGGAGTDSSHHPHSSRRQRRSRQWRAIASTGYCCYDAFWSGDAFATRARDLLGQRGQGCKGDVYGSVWTGSDITNLTAGAAAAVSLEAETPASTGYLMGLNSDVDDDGADDGSAAVDADVYLQSYNPSLLRRVSSSVIRRAALLSVAAAAASVTYQAEGDASGGAGGDGGGVLGRLAAAVQHPHLGGGGSGFDGDASASAEAPRNLDQPARPSCDGRARDEQPQASPDLFPSVPAAAAVTAAAAEDDELGPDDVSPFTALTAAAIATAAAQAAVDDVVVTETAAPHLVFPLTSSGPVLRPCASVPPNSSAARVRMAVYGLPAAWAVHTAAAPPPPLLPRPSLQAAVVGDGSSHYPDWGSGHTGMAMATVAAPPSTGSTAGGFGGVCLSSAHSVAFATSDVSTATGTGGGRGGAPGYAASGGHALGGFDCGGGGGVVDVAVRSAGRYLPVEWRWCRAAAAGRGVAASRAEGSGAQAASETGPGAETSLELTVAGVLGQGLVVVEVWFRGLLYASLPAVSTFDTRLVRELRGRASMDRPGGQVGQAVQSGGRAGAAADVGAGAPAGRAASPLPAPGLPQDVLYDLGTWLQYTAHVPSPLSPDPSLQASAVQSESTPRPQTPAQPLPSPPQQPSLQQEQQQQEDAAGTLSPQDDMLVIVRSGEGATPSRAQIQLPEAAAHGAAPSVAMRHQRPLDSAAAIHGGTSSSDTLPLPLPSAPTPAGGVPPPRPSHRPPGRSFVVISAAATGGGSRHSSPNHDATTTTTTTTIAGALPLEVARSNPVSTDGTLTTSYSLPGYLVSPPPASLDPGLGLSPSQEAFATNLFPSAALPRNAIGMAPGRQSLSFTSHAMLVSGSPAPATAAAASAPFLALPGSAAAGARPRPPLPSREGSEYLPTHLAMERRQSAPSLPPFAFATQASGASSAALTTAAGSATAAANPTLTAVPIGAGAGSRSMGLGGGSALDVDGVRLSPTSTLSASAPAATAATARARAFQDSAVDITVPILPGSLDLASWVLELQRGPAYGQRMQDMAVGLLAWLCQAGWPVAAGTVLTVLVRHRGMRFADVCVEVRRLPLYDGMSLLHLAVQSGSRAMLAAVAEWTQTHGSLLLWDELCAVGVAPLHQAAALVVTHGSPPNVAAVEAGTATDPTVGEESGGGAGFGGEPQLDESGLETLTWLLRRFPAARRMWLTAQDAYGSTPGAVLSYQLAQLPPAAIKRVVVALTPLVGPIELWTALMPVPERMQLPPNDEGPRAPAAAPSPPPSAARRTGPASPRFLAWVPGAAPGGAHVPVGGAVGGFRARLARLMVAVRAGSDSGVVGGESRPEGWSAEEPTAAAVALVALTLFWLLFCALAAA